ncbi:MAG: hypothetical protein JSR47_23805, partial [Proteobacteria bacterium]|nr:hypothetical protein [Pseudomonadota bacterium]
MPKTTLFAGILALLVVGACYKPDPNAPCIECQQLEHSYRTGAPLPPPKMLNSPGPVYIPPTRTSAGSSSSGSSSSGVNQCYLQDAAGSDYHW